MTRSMTAEKQSSYCLLGYTGGVAAQGRPLKGVNDSADKDAGNLGSATAQGEVMTNGNENIRVTGRGGSLHSWLIEPDAPESSLREQLPHEVDQRR